MKRTMAVVCLTAVLMGGASGAAWAALPSDSVYANCDEAEAAGDTDILRGDPAYDAGLDGDDDGVACEDGDSGAGQASEGSGSDDLSADNAADEDTVDDGGGQVAIVPEGAAPTGDGSTASMASSAHSWWIGSLLTALAGIGIGRRRAVSGR